MGGDPISLQWHGRICPISAGLLVVGHRRFAESRADADGENLNSVVVNLQCPLPLVVLWMRVQ